MENLEKINPTEYGLQEAEVQTIEQAFMPKIVERDALKTVYEQLITQEITQDLCRSAGDLRKKLVKVRTGIAEIHKTQKAFFLAAGRFVDAWKNKETKPVEQMEETLTAIEEHYERIEQARIAKAQQDRAAEIAQYQDATAFIPGNLGELTDEVYANYLLGVKTAFEQKKEDERIAKEAREKEEAEQKAEQERIRLENEQLKKEAAEHEAVLKKEREERERLEEELKDKADKERKAREEEEARIQADLQKGDSAKLADLISDLESLKTKYSFKSEKNKKKYLDVSILLDKIINHIK